MSWTQRGILAVVVVLGGGGEYRDAVDKSPSTLSFAADSFRSERR